jgi:lipoate-protein ligase A
MIPPSVRLLPPHEADGAWNMAADEVLLETAVAGRASLRFYTWTVPTLSLGYFQAAAVRLTDPRLAELPFVRRPSGGAALVHHHEVTYALALPFSLPWQRHGESWLCRMHGIITRALATLGVEVLACPCGEERKLGEVLCFLHHTPGDLIIGDAKVAGSAQRKRTGALLQHGGILLARSPASPVLPGIAELNGKRLPAAEVELAVADQFTHDTGWRLEIDDWTEPERRRIEELVEIRYADPEWNCRR